MERDVTINVRLKLIEDSALRGGGGAASGGGSAGVQKAMAGVTQEINKQRPAMQAVNQEFSRSVNLSREKLAISLKLLDIELAEEKRLKAQAEQERQILDLKTKQSRLDGKASGGGKGAGGGTAAFGQSASAELSASGFAGDIMKAVGAIFAAPETGRIILNHVTESMRGFSDEVLTGKGSFRKEGTSTRAGAEFLNFISGIPGKIQEFQDDFFSPSDPRERDKFIRGRRERSVRDLGIFPEALVPNSILDYKPFRTDPRDRAFNLELNGPMRHGYGDPNGPALLRQKNIETSQQEVVNLYSRQAESMRSLIDVQFKLRDVSLDTVRQRDRSLHGATSLDLNTANKIAAFVSANGGGMRGLSALTREQREIAESTPGVREQIALARDMDYRKNGLRPEAAATQQALSAAFGTGAAERAALTSAAMNLGIKQELAVKVTLQELDRLPKELEDKYVENMVKLKTSIIEQVRLMINRAMAFADKGGINN